MNGFKKILLEPLHPVMLGAPVAESSGLQELSKDYPKDKSESASEDARESEGEAPRERVRGRGMEGVWLEEILHQVLDSMPPLSYSILVSSSIHLREIKKERNSPFNHYSYDYYYYYHYYHNYKYYYYITIIFTIIKEKKQPMACLCLGFRPLCPGGSWPRRSPRCASAPPSGR